MSYGKSLAPCAAYRPWLGQEPLCGNCAWTKEEHERKVPANQKVVVIADDHVSAAVLTANRMRAPQLQITEALAEHYRQQAQAKVAPMPERMTRQRRRAMERQAEKNKKRADKWRPSLTR